MLWTIWRMIVLPGMKILGGKKNACVSSVYRMCGVTKSEGNHNKIQKTPSEKNGVIFSSAYHNICVLCTRPKKITAYDNTRPNNGHRPPPLI